MSGISFGNPHPRSQSGKKTLRRCGKNVEADKVILIDVDSDQLDNVIIIDVPDSLPKNYQTPSVRKKDKKRPYRTVICIDDDENSDDNPSGKENKNGNFGDGASSSKKSSPPSQTFEGAPDSAVEECQFVRDNSTPVRLSKCKRTYSGKATTGNRYGLNSDSESDASDIDYPDCELMEDPSGEVQEMWEKASFRRKKGIHSGQFGTGDQDGASKVSNDNHQTVRTESKSWQHKEAPNCSNLETYSDVNEAPPFVAREDRDTGRPMYDFEKPMPDDISLQALLRSNVHCGRSNIDGSSGSQAKNPPFNHAEHQDHQHYEQAAFSCQNKREPDPQASSDSRCKQNINQVEHDTSASRKNNKTPPGQPCMSRSGSCVDKNLLSGKASVVEEETPLCKGQNSYETETDTRSALRNEDCKFCETTNSSFKEEEHIEPSDPCGVSNVAQRDSSTAERSQQMDCGNPPSNVRVVPISGEVSLSGSSPLVSGTGPGSSCHPESVESCPDTLSFCRRHYNEAQIGEEASPSSEAEGNVLESMTNSQQDEERNAIHFAEDGDTLHDVGNCMINGREKLKETDEYKRALEEELASRQRALQIQAEEAQQLRRLRKRKNAEIMRLRDMERRQRQRLEEIRETQKKDEENMNLKEVIRAEVREELQKVETVCRDMASLLHGLGIQVGGWPQPSSREVQVAYKRALLAFHPDRASKSDIRQQVEAEEKFKIINRLKEKFLIS